jgi:hypothetical protein
MDPPAITRKHPGCAALSPISLRVSILRAQVSLKDLTALRLAVFCYVDVLEAAEGWSAD